MITSFCGVACVSLLGSFSCPLLSISELGQSVHGEDVPHWSTSELDLRFEKRLKSGCLLVEVIDQGRFECGGGINHRVFLSLLIVP